MNAEWLQWYYLIYALPAGVAVLVLLASGFGGHHSSDSQHGFGADHGGFDAGHHGFDTGHEHSLLGHYGAESHGAAGLHHADAGAHIAHGEAHGEAHGLGGHHAHHADVHGHEAGHDHGAGHDHDASTDARSPSLVAQTMSFFGVGRAPLTIVGGSFLIGWGVGGLAATEIIRTSLPSPSLFVMPAMGIAAASAFVSTKVFGEFCARVMPRDETVSISREDLVGLTGTVVYPVSATGGRVHIYDQYRTLHDEFARVPAGQPDIPKDTTVRLIALAPDGRFFLVEPVPTLTPPA